MSKKDKETLAKSSRDDFTKASKEQRQKEQLAKGAKNVEKEIYKQDAKKQAWDKKEQFTKASKEQQQKMRREEKEDKS